MSEQKLNIEDLGEVTAAELIYSLACKALGMKRPFGNSGFDYQIANALCEAGLMKGKKYQDGDYVEWEFNDKHIEPAVRKLMAESLGLDPKDVEHIEFY